MCGRFTLTNSAEAVARIFGLAHLPEFAPRFNIAPSQDVATVRLGHGGDRVLDLLRWGLIPSWTKDPAQARLMINARSETAAEKPSFRSAMSKRRCLVPASGFFEWKSEDGVKQPYYFASANGDPLAIASLFEVWHGKGGEIIESVSLLTTEANAVVSDVHDRMPVILAEDDFESWMDPQAGAADVSHLLVPCSPDRLESNAVSTRVNSARFDGPECIEPLS